jgi:holliday junction DNA helicase RuvA
MITSLRGTLVEALPTQITVEVQGVGYELLIPASSYDRLPQPGQEIHLLTHLVVREDAHTLYGFSTATERHLFRLLIQTVTGIGPRIALSILSGMNPTAFSSAVAQGDIRSLSQISGVGRKTAERIIVELRDKLASPTFALPIASPHAPGSPDSRLQDAALALVALGFKPPEASDTVRAVAAVLGASASVEDIVRSSLRKGAG